MDNIDNSFIDCRMNYYKQTILERLNKPQLNNNNISNQFDLLCLILEETPKLLEENEKEEKTYTIPSEAFPATLQENAPNIFTTSNITLRSNDKPTESNNQLELYNNHDKELIDFIRSFINDIIDNSCNKIQSLPKNIETPFANDYNDEEDDEEDYFELIDRRNKQIEANERKALKVKSKIPKKSLSENLKLKVYLFQRMDYLEVDLKPEDTFYSIKMRIFQQLKNSNKLPNKNTTHNDYEFKDFKKNKLLSHALIETENVLNFNKSKIVLIEKLKLAISSRENTDEGKASGDLSKMHLKVHIKFDKKNSYSTLIPVDGDMPLSNAFDKLKSKLIYKNKEFYYFVEHSDKNENEDMDNAINIDILIKYLSTFSLDLYMKTYSDIPDLFSAIRNQYFTNMPDISIDKKKGCESVNTNFLYNDINVGVYQEFSVTKINRHQTRQERILGIDLYNLYNSLPKKSSTFFSILQGKIKMQLRKITDVQDCNQLTDKSLFIDVVEDGKVKRIIYEVKNSTTKNQIISKIRYLMVSIYELHLLEI